MRVEVDALFPAAPEAVWSVIVDWEGQAGWMRDVDRIHVLGERREGSGVRVAAKTRVFGLPAFTDALEVTVWDPPERLVISHRGFVRGLGVWTLELEEGGTRFRWSESLSLPVPVVGELALLVYRPVQRRMMRAALEGLRRITASPTG